MTIRVLRPDDLAERLGVSRTTLWRWERAGILPRRRAIGPNTNGWPADEIATWLDNRPVVGGGARAQARPRGD